jgi:two-component system response regulator VicR
MGAKKKILIVEDDQDILSILELIFSSDGYDVELSSDGEKTEHLTEIKPDIVLLDIRLENSGRNGAFICAAIKAKSETKSLPVILLSAETGLKQISKNCGADGYFAKPLDLEDLLWECLLNCVN